MSQSKYFLTSIAIDEVSHGGRSDLIVRMLTGPQYESKDFGRLRGCVNDATNFAACLASVMGPPSAALSLFNAEATRENILSSFRSYLIDNPDIEEGDRIIVFYAGHGSTAKAPDDWGGPSDVETICPVDESMPGPDGAPTPGIPDVTLNALFRILARSKGNNIVSPPLTHSVRILTSYKDLHMRLLSFWRLVSWSKRAREFRQIVREVR
jgi:hypothetical protein